MSIIGFFTGLLAVINQILRLRPDEKEDEEMETFARELDQVEARLDEHEAQLDALQHEDML